MPPETEFQRIPWTCQLQAQVPHLTLPRVNKGLNKSHQNIFFLVGPIFLLLLISRPFFLLQETKKNVTKPRV